jgi:hypothetical protein
MGAMTRLQAVNRMLEAVGESVILVEVAGAGDYANCSSIIDQVTSDLLAKDWDFNTEVRTLTPATDGTIVVTPEVLKIDPVDPYANYVERQGKLYDKTKNTFVFTQSVDVNVTLLFSFEDCPYHVQRAIAATAAQRYQRNYVGSATADKFISEDRFEAGADAADAESTVDDYNILDNPDFAWLRRRTFNNGSIN